MEILKDKKFNINNILTYNTEKDECLYYDDVKEALLKFKYIMLDIAEDKDLDGLEDDFDKIFGDLEE